MTDFAAGRADLESGRVFLPLRLQTVQRREGLTKRSSPIDKKKIKITSDLRSSEKNNLLAILKQRITRPLCAPESLQLRPSAHNHINIPHPGASLWRVTNSATEPTGSIKQRGGKNGDKCRQASECYLIRRVIRRRRGTTRVIWPPESSSDRNPSTAPWQTMMDRVRSCRIASRPLATGGGFLQKCLEESESWRTDCAVDLLGNRKRFFLSPPCDASSGL